MERGSRMRSSSAGSEKMEKDGDRQEKNGRTYFDRPKPTAGCSANERRRRKRRRGGVGGGGKNKKEKEEKEK